MANFTSKHASTPLEIACALEPSRPDPEKIWQALEQGYTHETCDCGSVFLAHIHFVRCTPHCPMVSKTDKRTVFEQLFLLDADDV
jgi:hypothetical protein